MFDVSVDNARPTQVDPSKGATPNAPVPAIVYSKTGLSDNETHTLNVTYFSIGSQNGPYIEIYGLE